MHKMIQAIDKRSLKTNLPIIKPGMGIRVHQKIVEGKRERLQVFEGLVLYKSGGEGVGGTFTVRKMVEGIGVEKTFPLHSPVIAKIEITKQADVRRSKLYFMRNRSGKSTRLKSKMVEKGLYVPGSEEVAKEEGTTEQSSADVSTPTAVPEEGKKESKETEAKGQAAKETLKAE